MIELVTLRTTLKFRVLQGITNAALAAVVFGLLGLLLDHPLAYGAAGVGIIVVLVELRIAKRSLTVFEGGILVRRDKYEISSPWSSVGPIRSGRFALVVPIVTLPLDPPATISPIDRDVSDRLQRKIRSAGADRKVLLSAFTNDWRAGEFGAALQRYRPDLLDTETTTL
jgi:hypothetical protein